MGEPALTVTLPNGQPHVLYRPHPKQLQFHQDATPNLIAIGSRGSGKSLALRMDAHMRALSVPNSTSILVRKTYKDLISSHLIFLKDEMQLLGGRYHETNHIAEYPTRSKLFLAYVGSEGLNLLGAELLAAYFDELSVIPWDFFTKIGASVRVAKGSNLTALVRAATNPLGGSAYDIQRYFVDHSVDPEEDSDYVAADWKAIRMDMEDNPFLDVVQYRKRFSGLPEHVRRAWLDGEFSYANSLFALQPMRNGKPYHVIPDIDLPKILRTATVYRTIDSGWFPDPTIVLWIAHLGNRHIVFHEKLWYRTTSADVAEAIRDEDARLGVRKVAISFCDPSMDINTTADVRTIKEIYEANGIPLECSINKRDAFATAVHNALAEEAGDHLPRIQFYVNGRDGCPYLVRTIPQMRYDPDRPLFMADHKEDHAVVALAYYLMSHSSDERKNIPSVTGLRPWQKPKPRDRFLLDQDNVR